MKVICIKKFNYGILTLMPSLEHIDISLNEVFELNQYEETLGEFTHVLKSAFKSTFGTDIMLQLTKKEFDEHFMCYRTHKLNNIHL